MNRGKPMTTNYERIKNMTVDKMAKFLRTKLACETCPTKCHCMDDLVVNKDKCFGFIKKWLESESEA